MMKIGIDINGVLRDTIGKFTQLYEKHLIESSEESFMGNTYELDLSGNTELIEVESNNFEYKKVSDVDSLELDKHFVFKSKEEFFSFMYEDYAMELFGHAPSTEMTTFNTLNDLYHDLRDENDILIVSSEIGKSKPASLFFLSKFGCLLEKVIFFSEITKNSMWNDVDILLTADPNLLLEKPVDKIVVKFNTNYNKHIKSEFEISSLSEFGELIKTLKQNV
jgi:hypothetical protein